MSTNFNKKKFIFIPSFKKIKYLIIILTLILFLFLIYEELYFKKKYKELLQEFSVKYNYLLESYETNTITRVERIEISKIINKYLGKSIFLIPLSNISYEINNLKWVKGVNLSTNLKNKIKVEILEYESVGLYFFNDQMFYFSKEGKIIDKYNDKLDEKFIIFSGKNAIKHAVELLKIIDDLKDLELIKIEEAYYINERRWDLKFTNQMIVFLSEKNIATSLINYIKLIKQLKESEILSIKSIDLRNNKKAIINFE
jgi:cell division septal protein FtsQ